MSGGGMFKILLTLLPHHGFDDEGRGIKAPTEFWEVHPPPGVPVVVLERIDILLNLSTVSNRAIDLASTDYKGFLRQEKQLWEIQALARRQRRQLLDNPACVAAHGLSEGLEGEAESNLAARASIMFSKHELLDACDAGLKQDSPTPIGLVTRGQDPDHYYSSPADTSSASCGQTSGLSSQSSATTLLDLDYRAAPPMECPSDLAKSSAEDFIQLIDASMRDLLFGHTLSRKSGLTKTDNGEQPTLCTLSPMVFGPGALKSFKGSHTPEHSHPASQVLLEDELLSDQEARLDELLDNEDDVGLIMGNGYPNFGGYQHRTLIERESEEDETLLDYLENGFAWSAGRLLSDLDNRGNILSWSDGDASTDILDHGESSFEDLLEISMLDPTQGHESQRYGLAERTNVRPHIYHDDTPITPYNPGLLEDYQVMSHKMGGVDNDYDLLDVNGGSDGMQHALGRLN
ncbi:MAG: hypothetical protein Q9217_006175 [Psora testacea]